MFPDSAKNHASQAPSLPPLTAQPPQAQPAPMPAGPQSEPSAGAAEHYAQKAKQAIAQYGNDPYRLSEALSQLKNAYLSEQYHITISKPGN